MPLAVKKFSNFVASMQRNPKFQKTSASGGGRDVYFLAAPDAGNPWDLDSIIFSYIKSNQDRINNESLKKLLSKKYNYKIKTITGSKGSLLIFNSFDNSDESRVGLMLIRW